MKHNLVGEFPQKLCGIFLVKEVIRVWIFFDAKSRLFR